MGRHYPIFFRYSKKLMEKYPPTGWHGTPLHVDLSTGKSRAETIPRELLLSYLGGRGLGVRLLRDAHTLDPYHPAMPLIFAAGPPSGAPPPPPPPPRGGGGAPPPPGAGGGSPVGGPFLPPEGGGGVAGRGPAGENGVLFASILM